MNRASLAWLIVAVTIAALLGVSLYYPLFFVVESAFNAGGRWSLALFGLLMRNRLIVSSLMSSIALGVVVSCACVAIALPLAWFSSRYRLPAQGMLNTLVLLPMILPPFVGAIGIRHFLSRFGTLNILLMEAGIIRSPINWLGSGFWGVAVLETLHLFPIVYLNVGAAMSNINPAYEEAARTLGAGGWRLMRTIVVPLLMPGIFAGTGIVFIWSVTDLGTPLVLDYRNVVAYQIYSMINDIHENPLGYALVVFTLLWVTAVYFSVRFLLRTPGNVGTVKGMGAVSRSAPSVGTTIIALGAFVAVGCTALIPHAMVVLSAIAKRWFMTALPEQYTFDYLASIATHPLTALGIRNSIFLSAVTTLVVLVVGIATAYLLTRWKCPGRGLLDFSVMLPLAVPGLILAFGYVGAFAGTRFDPRMRPFPLLIAAYAVRRLPFMVRSVAAGLTQADPSMEEASFMVGASRMRTIVHITLPLISANIVAGAVLVFTFAALEVSDSLILAMKENYYPLTKAIYALSLRVADGIPMASALGIVAMLVLAIGLIVSGKILGKGMGGVFRM